MISHCLFAVLSLPTLVLNIGSIRSISICIEILLIRLALETLGTESLRKVLGMLYNRYIDVTVSCSAACWYVHANSFGDSPRPESLKKWVGLVNTSHCVRVWFQDL